MIMIIRRVHEALNFSTRMRSIRRRYENSREKVQNVLGDSSDRRQHMEKQDGQIAHGSHRNKLAKSQKC